MKYIDSEKLIAEIERYENTAIEAYNPLGEDADFWHGRVVTYEDLKTFITSLQQEQSMPDSTELIAKWEEEKDVLKQMNFRGDGWRLAQNAFMDGFGIGLSVKQEQPEVELDREIIKYKVPFTDEKEYLNETTLDAIARHFYNLALADVKGEVAKLYEEAGPAIITHEGGLEAYFKRVALKKIAIFIDNLTK